MSKQHPTLALAVGAVLAGGLSLSGSAFAIHDLAQGYMVGAHAVAEGKCGGKGGQHTLAQVDTDKDGRISPAEFAAAHGGDGSRFAKYDTDKDGFISAAEMKAAHEGKRGEGKADGQAKDKAAHEGKCGGAV
jgi:uncharacterized low-complexity protein